MCLPSKSSMDDDDHQLLHNINVSSLVGVWGREKRNLIGVTFFYGC